MKTAKARLILVCISIFAISLVFTSLSYARIDPESIVGLWLFDEGKGDTVKDSSGKENDGTLMNTPAWVKGKFGTALDFDGKDDSISIADTDELSGGVGKKLTVVAWFNPSDVAGTYKGIVSKYRDASEKDWGLLVNGGRLEFGYETGANDWESSTPLRGGTLSAGTWYHGAFVLDGKNVKLYLDGNELGAAELPSDTPNTIANAEIGAVSYKPFYYKGIIDEVAIFNAALGVEDIEAIMTRGLEAALGMVAVSPAGRLSITWGGIKAEY